MPHKKFVSRQVVIDYVNNLHPAKLMYSINYVYNKHKIEEKTAETFSLKYSFKFVKILIPV